MKNPGVARHLLACCVECQIFYVILFSQISAPDSHLHGGVNLLLFIESDILRDLQE